MSGLIKAAYEVVWAHIINLPWLGIMIVYATLHAISVDLLDYIWDCFYKDTIFGIKGSERYIFLGTTEGYKCNVEMTLADMRKNARLGKPAPDSKLFDMQNNRWVNLLQFGGRSQKPMAVIFGSCS